MSVAKQYYKTSKESMFVGLKGQTSQDVQLNATGRQVPITVTSNITGNPVPNAEIQILKTSAKTDKKGTATIVLPTTSDTAEAPSRLRAITTQKLRYRLPMRL